MLDSVFEETITPIGGGSQTMLRVPVLSPDGKPLMPTQPSRARPWIQDSLALVKWLDVGMFYVQRVEQPSGEETEPIAVGVDPGKLYSGIGLLCAKATLFIAHLILPFQTIKDRRVVMGWVSGDRARQVSVSNCDCPRLGQFMASTVQLIHRATGLMGSRLHYYLSGNGPSIACRLFTQTPDWRKAGE